MSFIKKTWLARIGVGLNRFRMNNSTDVVLESNPISVTQQGDQLSADNMNNLETRIGNAFDEMAGNLAPIEISPASTNHAVGTQIVYNGILYKVTSAISTDDNLVVGTNIEPYPVSSALSDITTLLWTNPSSTLAESDVNLGDLSSYRFIDIECYYTENNEKTGIQRFLKGNSGTLVLFTVDTSGSAFNLFNATYRFFSWKNSTTIHFESAKMIYQSMLYNNWDNRCVPRRIWGVK